MKLTSDVVSLCLSAVVIEQARKDVALFECLCPFTLAYSYISTILEFLLIDYHLAKDFTVRLPRVRSSLRTDLNVMVMLLISYEFPLVWRQYEVNHLSQQIMCLHQ